MGASKSCDMIAGRLEVHSQQTSGRSSHVRHSQTYSRRRHTHSRRRQLRV